MFLVYVFGNLSHHYFFIASNSSVGGMTSSGNRCERTHCVAHCFFHLDGKNGFSLSRKKGIF